MKTIFKIKRYKTIITLFGLLLLIVFLTVEGVEQSTETLVVSKASVKELMDPAVVASDPVVVDDTVQIAASPEVPLVESEPRQIEDKVIELAAVPKDDFPQWINAAYNSMSPQEVAQAKASIPIELQDKIDSLSFAEQAAIYAAVAIGLEMEKNK